MPPSESRISTTDVHVSPLASRRAIWRSACGSERIVWSVIAIACSAVLATALWLKPSPDGMGTHEALGLPPCGFVYSTGLPCPTCGMTTAFAHGVRGNLIASFIAQPAGLVLFLIASALAIYGSVVAVRGRALRVNWDRYATRIMISLAFLIFGGWGFKLAVGFVTGTYPVH